MSVEVKETENPITNEPTTNEQTKVEPFSVEVNNESTAAGRTDNMNKVTKITKYEPGFQISYKWFMWGQIIFFTLITVIDRYTTNLWPLWVNSAGPTIPGNWSATIFTLVSWISSRMMLVSCAYIFLLQNHIFWNWFSEHKPSWLYVGDIIKTNKDIHYYLGIWFIGVPVILHVWTIVIPAGIANNMYLYWSWWRPKKGVTNIDFWDGKNNLFNLALNDVYRIISTSISFFILFPISMSKKCRKKCFNKTMWIHLIAATIFTVDLIRMKSHPHCWFFNCPFILWWMIDRWYGVYFYRKTTAKIIKKINIENEYLIVLISVNNEIAKKKNIGDCFHLLFKNCEMKFEKSHVFTTFQNHFTKNNMQIFDINDKHKFRLYNAKNINDINKPLDPQKNKSTSEYILSRLDSTVYDISIEGNDKNDEIIVNKEDTWNIGFIMRIYKDHDNCFDKKKTFTNHFLKRDDENIEGGTLICWGPWRNDYRNLMTFNAKQQYPLILIATGAGCGYMIDFYQYIIKNKITLHYEVYFHFSTNCVGLYQWFTDITCKNAINNLFINVHLTKKSKINYKPKPQHSNLNERRESVIGRMSFEEIINNAVPDTHVYMCGSPILQDKIGVLCKKNKLRYFYGTTF